MKDGFHTQPGSVFLNIFGYLFHLKGSCTKTQLSLWSASLSGYSYYNSSSCPEGRHHCLSGTGGKKRNLSDTICRTFWWSEGEQTSGFTQTLKEKCTWCTHSPCTPTHIYPPLHHRSCCRPQGMRSPHPPQQSSGRRELWCTWVCNTGLNWRAHVSCGETQYELANKWAVHVGDM